MTISANYPSVIPSLSLDFANSGVLDNRITFTRSTTGAYYNGYSSAVAEQNLLLYSQNYTVANWNKQLTTNTANTTVAPDGTTTASTLTATAGAGEHGIYQTITSAAGVNTLSSYIQAGTAGFATLNLSTTSGNYAYAIFNLSTGAVTQSAGLGSFTYTTASSVLVNGFYRLTLTATCPANPVIQIMMSTSGTGTVDAYGVITFTAVGTETIYAWGAQLEQRSSVTAYTPTTTTAITNYIPVLQTGAINQARFDHDPVLGTSLGLLIEQQSTNLLLQSQFASGWSYSGASGVLAANIAPDGTQTAVKLVENTATGQHENYQVFTLTTTPYTDSVYLKSAGRTWAWVTIQDVSELGAYFDLTNGVLGTVAAGVTATITSVGNGWYRCSVSRTTASSGICYLNIYIASANNSASYTGDGFSGIYIWGAQLEALAFPTSYIPTVASQVTRSADLAVMTGTNFSSWYNNAQGTFFGSVNIPTTTLVYSGIINSQSVLGYGVYANGANGVSSVFGANAVNQTFGANQNFATSYTTISLALSASGQAVSVATSGIGSQQITSLQIGLSSYPRYLNGYIKKIQYYPIAVTNAQLQALTGS